MFCDIWCLILSRICYTFVSFVSKCSQHEATCRVFPEMMTQAVIDSLDGEGMAGMTGDEDKAEIESGNRQEMLLLPEGDKLVNAFEGDDCLGLLLLL